jgi:hypothetical protein
MRHRTILAVLLVGILAMTLTSATGKPPAKPKTSEQGFDEIVELMDDPIRSGLFAVHQIKEMAVKSKEFEAGIDALQHVADAAAEPPVRRAALFVLAEMQKELGHIPEAMEALARSCTAPERPGCRCPIPGGPNCGCPKAPGQRSPSGCGGCGKAAVAGGAVKTANVEVLIANPFEADARPVKSATISGRGKIVIMGPDGKVQTREFDIPLNKAREGERKVLRFEHRTNDNGNGEGEKRDRESRERGEREIRELEGREREMHERARREREQHERELNERREREEHRRREEPEHRERQQHEREMDERRERAEREHRGRMEEREREEMRGRRPESHREMGEIHRQVEQRFERIGHAIGENRRDIDRLARMTQELAGALRRLHHEQQEQAEEMEEFVDDLAERFMDDEDEDE